jgi:peptidyl-prolyl cis-trans isomerase C
MRSTILISILAVFIASAALAADDTVATVNGTKIKQQTLDTYTKFIQAANQGAQVDSRLVLSELIKMELLYQEALKQKIDKEPEVAVRAEMQRKELLANALLQKSGIGAPVADDELKKIYDEKIKSQNITEYKARHILVKSEDEAKTIIADLDKGGSFEELAKSKSTDAGTKEHGGDLGWFAAPQMVPEFTQAVAALQKGSYTKTPVKTNYGYHVIKLEDSRPATPPSFDDSKKRIIASIQNARLLEYIETLRKKAKIDIKGDKANVGAAKSAPKKAAKKDAAKTAEPAKAQ